jgi:SWIM zinc finger
MAEAETEEIVSEFFEVFSPRQIEKALEIVECGRIRRTEFADEFVVIGSHGDHYLATAAWCSCRNPGPCSHMAGVRLHLARTAVAA